MRAVLLDTAADAAAAAGVAITGAIVFVAGGFYWLDPAVALVISAVVAYHALRLLHRVAVVLRWQSRPGHDRGTPCRGRERSGGNPRA